MNAEAEGMTYCKLRLRKNMKASGQTVTEFETSTCGIEVRGG
jgi:hypothetical protein